jgi:hypothetical protein
VCGCKRKKSEQRRKSKQRREKKIKMINPEGKAYADEDYTCLLAKGLRHVVVGGFFSLTFARIHSHADQSIQQDKPDPNKRVE